MLEDEDSGDIVSDVFTLTVVDVILEDVNPPIIITIPTNGAFAEERQVYSPPPRCQEAQEPVLDCVWWDPSLNDWSGRGCTAVGSPQLIDNDGNFMIGFEGIPPPGKVNQPFIFCS